MRNNVRLSYGCLLAATIACFGYAVPADAVTPYWFDGFDVSATTSDINFETALRQGGAPTPVPYVANSANPANDYHHQMFGGGGTPLQLAGDANLLTAMVSPNMDFSAVIGNEVVGKKVEISMDAFVNNAGGTYFSTAALTVGSSAPLDQVGSGLDGFSISFVEDTFAGNGNFIQVYDGANLVSNLVPNPAGAFGGFVEIFVDDPIDGNPWDGVGSTVFDVFVNGTQIDANNPANPGLSYTALAASYTSNYITLEGAQQSVGVQLATHTFDGLLVSTGPAIPEPSSALLALGMLSGLGVSMRRVRY